MEPLFSSLAGFMLGSLTVLFGTAAIVCQGIAIAIFNGNLNGPAPYNFALGTIIEPGIWGGIFFLVVGGLAIVSGWARKGNVIRALNVTSIFCVLVAAAAIVITSMYLWMLDSMDRNSLTTAQFPINVSALKFNTALEVHSALMGLYGTILAVMIILLLVDIVFIYITFAHIYRAKKYKKYGDRKDSDRSDRPRSNPLYGQMYGSLPYKTPVVPAPVLPAQVARPQVYDPYSLYYTYPNYRPSYRSIALPAYNLF